MKRLLVIMFMSGALVHKAQELLPNGSFEDNLVINNYDENNVGYFDTTDAPCHCPIHTIHFDAGSFHFESMAYLSQGVPYAWGVFYQDCHRTGITAQTYWDNPWANWEDALAMLAESPSLYGFIYGDGIWRQYPQEGDWFISLHSFDTVLHQGEYSIENREPGFSMALTQPLEPGNWYELNYYIMGPVYPYSCLSVAGANPIKIGLSNDERLFGDSIHLSYLPYKKDTSWILQTHCFQAQESYDYLTVMGHLQYDTSYAETILFLDNFSLQPCSPCDTLAELPDNPVDSNEVGLTERPSQELSLYPNPFADLLHIETKGARIAIYDLLGKLHYQQELSETQRSILSLEGLPVGIYVLEVMDSKDQRIASEKIIKIRQ